jgi:hypothetical protein
MNEGPPEKADTGPLLWPRFYGPSIEYTRSAFDKYVKASMAVVASALFLATGILLITGGTDPRWGAFNILIAAGIPVFYYVLDRNARTSMDYEAMRRRGDLDWDIHENGLLTREYAADLPGRVRAGFVSFESLSKAYFNIGPENARTVWELVKVSARERHQATGEEDVGSDFLWDGGVEAMVGRFVWLVDRKSGHAVLRLDRAQISDPPRLEKLLRQKLKEVV